MKPMKHIQRALLVLLCSLTGPSLPAQLDSLPLIIEGQADLLAFKQGAPEFNQKDLVMYIVAKEGLAKMFNDQPDKAWIDDWHFLDMNNDGALDAIYSGANRYYKGHYSMFMFGNASIDYPPVFRARGYIHKIRKETDGLRLHMRKEAYGADYLTKMTHYHYLFKEDTTHIVWQSQVVAGTQIPAFREIEGFELRMDAPLHSSPEELKKPPMDYDQDGTMDADGNVLASFPAGSRLLRTARETVGGESWSFVTVVDPPAEGHVFQPIDGVRMGYCGWMRSEMFEREKPKK